MAGQYPKGKEQHKSYNREGTTQNDSKNEASTSRYNPSGDYIRTHTGLTRPGMTSIERQIANIDWRSSPEFTTSPDGIKIPVERYRKEENIFNDEYRKEKTFSNNTSKQKKQNKKFKSFGEWEKEQQEHSLEHKAKTENEIESRLVHIKKQLESEHKKLESAKSQMVELDKIKSDYIARLQSLKNHLETEQKILNFNQTLFTQELDNEKSLDEKLSNEILNLERLKKIEKDTKLDEENQKNIYKNIEDKITYYNDEIKQYLEKKKHYQEYLKNNVNSPNKMELEQLRNSYIQEKETLSTQLTETQSERKKLEREHTKTDTDIRQTDESIKKSQQLIEDLKLLSSHPPLTDQNMLMKELNTLRESQKETSTKAQKLEERAQTLKSSLDTLTTQCGLDQQLDILETIKQAKNLLENLKEVKSQYTSLTTQNKNYCNSMNTLYGFDLKLTSSNIGVASGPESLSQWTKAYKSFEANIQEKMSQFEKSLSNRSEREKSYNMDKIYLESLKDAYIKITDATKDSKKKNPHFVKQVSLELTSKIDNVIALTPKQDYSPQELRRIEDGWRMTNDKVIQLYNQLEKENPNINKIQTTCKAEIRNIDKRLNADVGKYERKITKLINEGKTLLKELFNVIDAGRHEYVALFSSISQFEENIEKTERAYKSVKETRSVYIKEDNIQTLITNQESHIKALEIEQSKLHEIDRSNVNNKVIIGKKINNLQEKLQSKRKEIDEMNFRLGDILYKEGDIQQSLINYENIINNFKSEITEETKNKSKAEKNIKKKQKNLKETQDEILLAETSIQKARAALNQARDQAEESTSNLRAEINRTKQDIHSHKIQYYTIEIEKDKFMNEQYNSALKEFQYTNTESIHLQSEIEVIKGKLNQINIEKMQIEHKEIVAEITKKLKKDSIPYWMHGGDVLNTSLDNIVRFPKLLKDDAIAEVIDRDHTNTLFNDLSKNLKSFFNSVDQKSDTLEIRKTLIKINQELENIRKNLQLLGIIS
jgi:hypothetical protein